MKHIQKWVEMLDEEIEGAKDYAEKYVECEVKSNLTRANKFKEIANDASLNIAVIFTKWRFRISKN